MITYSGNKYKRRIVCSLGTEPLPTDGDAEAGVDISEFSYLTIHVRGDAPFPANAALVVAMYNPATGEWNQNHHLIYDLTEGATRESFPMLDVSNRQGRLALIPVGAVPMTIDVHGTRFA